MNTGAHSYIICALLLWASALLPARPKLDTLVMKNGDRITCEVKKLEYGQLHIKTTYSIGTIVIDWKKVDRVESGQLFQLQTGAGDLMAGSLRMQSEASKPYEEQEVEISTQAKTVAVKQPDIVQIEQLEDTFWGNVNGGVDLGLGLTKANSQKNFNLSSDLIYEGKVFDVKLNQKSYFSKTGDAQTNRHEGTVSYSRYRRQFFVQGLSNFLSSDEQKLDLRTTAGGGVGRYFARTNKNVFSTIGGFVLNNERFSPETGREVVNNLEGMVAAEYYTFRFDASEFRTYVAAFPSITDPGRYRINADMRIYWKISGRLKMSIGFTNNFDSRPPAGTPRNDYVLTSSVRVDLK